VDVRDFEVALSGLSVVEIRSISADLTFAVTTTAEEIAATRAVLVIEQTLRRAHRLHSAATIAVAAATAVQDVAARARIDLPDADVTRVARAAAQLARGLVAADFPGVDGALRCLVRGWHSVPVCAELVAA
jgi:peroxiredoxin